LLIAESLHCGSLRVVKEEKMFAGDERIADIGFTPVDELHASLAYDYVPWIHISMNHRILDFEALHDAACSFKEIPNLENAALLDTRSLG
jgi:hypothetical protein